MARPTAGAAAAKREQILEEAILRYEDTSLRAIAADVGIDVAHVHCSFGSKELLFAEAVCATRRPERFLGGPPGLLAAKLSAEILVRQAMHDNDEVRPLDILMRSLSSREASWILHDSALTDFIEPISKMTYPSSARRAAMIAAVLLGIGVLREVLTVEPLLDTEDGEVQQLTIQLLKVLIGARPYDVAARAAEGDDR
ncbi:TetR/AcrR family transcriptional regulator [Hyphomicrobium sp. B1]|uniref:TetR/AcrR family transcriptional regulator n=1 Tax=unclassified Hyphomicrobium TaxID=2619925 RepID=UPI0039C30525